MSDENESWLPNLVGGVSIWKLAPDLNEEQFFDGRLLVPETEGSDSLPVRVEWDLTGLVPLPEAREKHGARVEEAIAAFFECLERTARVFEKGGSGYDKYKAAFTVPALDADGGAHYFFDPADGKLKVINWGASPRKIRHEKHYLFGYQDFAALIRKEREARDAGEPGAGRASASGASAAESGAGDAPDAGAAPGASEEGKKEEKKEEEEKEDEEKGVLWGKPWWNWLLYLVVLLFLIWFAFALLRDCEQTSHLFGGADAGADAGAETPIYGRSTDDGGPPATELHDGGAGEGGDGSVGADAGSASGDGGGAGGASDGGGSGADAGSGSGSGSGGGSGSGSVGPPTDEDGRPIYGEVDDPDRGHVYWAPGPGGRAITLPHREYYHPDAAQWRIVGGTRKVYDYSGAGSTFRVYLRPGESFDGVRVQWRDRAGHWHDH